jgi:glycosyltransferase involved in cell wall biosynthesis
MGISKPHFGESKPPLVTVVVLCYEQSAYVTKALDSVVMQTYPSLQLIIIDDGSKDGSGTIIKQWVQSQTRFLEPEMILLPQNLGMTKAFAHANGVIKGKYLIDLSADDMMVPTRVERQVACFEATQSSNNKEVAMVYSDALWVSPEGQPTGNWYQGRPLNLRLVAPQDQLTMLLQYNHICTPTIMYRTDTWLAVGGFDTQYVYEDLPIFLQFAVHGFDFRFLDECLTIRRRLTGSATSRQYIRAKNGEQNPTLNSTLALCIWAAPNCLTTEQQLAFAFFTRHHLRLAAVLGHHNLANKFHVLLKGIKANQLTDKLLLILTRLPLPWHRLLDRH